MTRPLTARRVGMMSSAVAYLGALAGAMLAQQPAGMGLYAQAQAVAGKSTYEQSCAECHRLDLGGSAHGPALAGPDFLAQWGKRPVSELIAYTKAKMPPGAAGSLSDDAYLNIVSYVLQANGHAAGRQALRADATTTVGAGTGVAAAAAPDITGDPSAAPTVPVVANKPLPSFTPVTDAMLRNPPAGDWLSWRRTLDGHGYSPLADINRSNVRTLRLAWAWTMREGSNQTVPLVHDGVMFLANTLNVVQAIDARTGTLMWEYRHAYPPQAMTLGGPTRSIALYRDKIFLSTYDAALVAIDARTGKEVWKTVKADYTKGYTHTSGPVVAGGVLVSGINGCERYKEESCFITGHDPDTGRELWRTSTIARPGDPADATWGGVPWNRRAGGDSWIPGSYDPQLGLFYVGTAQAKPWMAASRGMSPLDAALYTNSTLAIDPRSGKIVWHFQHVPGETLDMDVAYERVLVDVADRKYVFTAGKDGVLWKLDRRTGRFIDYVETVYQNVFQSIDRESGRVLYRQDILEAKLGQPVSACPGLFGGHNWWASAFSPETHALVIPLLQACMEMTSHAVQNTDGGGGFGAGSKLLESARANGKPGKLAAYDVRTMKALWSHEQRAPFLTSALTTGGRLVFVGDADRSFKAFDVETGKPLWETRLAAPVQGFPVTYRAGGKQFVAVTTGMGVSRFIPATLAPEIYLPNGGNALYVFELPD